MAKENSNKVKLLKLIELLRQESDEQHPMRGSIVCQRLSEMNISCDRKTLTRDIAALNEYGYEVMSTMVSHEKAYYVAERSFSVPELKILIDAVQAASFVTEKKTAELIEKIAALGGSHCAEILMPDLNDFYAFKSTTSGSSGSSSRRGTTGGGNGGDGDVASTLSWVAAIISLIWIIGILFG